MKYLICATVVLLIFTSGCGRKSETQVSPSEYEETATVTEDVATEAPEVELQEVEAITPEVSAPAEPTPFVKPSVEDIQTALKNAGLYDGKIDGNPGPKTKKAIETFQTQNNLKVDGKVGPKTWEKLQSYLNKVGEGAISAEQNRSPVTVTNV